MSEIFKSTGSYATSLAWRATKSGNSTSYYSGTSDIPFNIPKIYNNINYIEKVTVFFYAYSASDNSYYNGWSVNYKYLNKEYGGNAVGTGWLSSVLDTPTKIGNVIGQYDYYNISYTASAVSNYTVPLEDIPSGATIVRSTINIGARNGAYEAYLDVDWLPAYYKPVLSTVSPVAGFYNPNSIIKLDWNYSCPDETLQKTYTIEWKNGSSGTVNTITAESALSEHNIPSNTFPAGSEIYWRVKAKSTTDTESDFTDWAIFNLYIAPSVIALEPNNINQNIELPINVSWSSQNQSTYKLTLDGKVYTGTTAKNLIIPANIITSGTKTMTLEITYQGVGYTTTATKTVTFLAYGKPPVPTLLNKTIISTATPLIKWSSTEQVSYDFKILKGSSNIVATGEVISTSQQYNVTTALENNTTYAIKLKVKNQYGLWSDYATGTFTTSFIVPNTPSISGFANITNGSIILNVETETSPEYKNTEIWRKEPYGEWKRMAYNLAEVDAWEDSYVKSNTEYEYKARSIGQTGGVAESDPIALSTKVNYYTFYNVEDLNNNIRFEYNARIKSRYNRNNALTMYAGCVAPSYETDDITYKSYVMQFATKDYSHIDKLASLLKSSKLLLYKDVKGNKAFGQIFGSFEPITDDLEVTTIEFNFTELSFLEQDVYAGDNTGLKLLMWDGTWMFDGTYVFGGGTSE
jgi:hypothetical protein